jgi:site-specific DNA-methyltransferase (adenine-specific)
VGEVDAMTANLHKAEALSFLASLPDASVEAVITDPPYSSGGMMRSDRTGSTVSKYVQSDSSNRDLGDFSGDNRDARAYAYWCSLWLSECLRITRPGGVCLLFTDWRQLPGTTDALQAGGWVWRGLVPWAKTTYRPQAGRFAAQCEHVVWGSAGGMPVDYTDDCLPGFFSAASPREREHITQKPLDVMRRIVQIAPKGGVVLDPFMGSGTTGVAAVLEGRGFVGSEQVQSIFNIAHRRITAAEQGYRDDGTQMVLGVEQDGAA